MVEFETQVKDGVIEIPEQYKQELSNGRNVKVVVTTKEQKQRSGGIMDELAKNPISVKGLRKLTREEMHDRHL